MTPDEWDVVRFVRLFARCRTTDIEEQKRIEKQLLVMGTPYPFQEMLSTIRSKYDPTTREVNQWACDHPHHRSFIAALRQSLSDSQVLLALRNLPYGQESQPTHHRTPEASRPPSC